VNDYAGLLAADARGRLEAKLAGYESATGTQMAIAIFRSLEGESLEDVASRLFQSWRLGAKGLDNGVLLVVFVQDRKLRFEIGYGLEAVVPDAAAGQIIRELVAPRFREQRYAAGLEAAADAVYARIGSGTARPAEGSRRQRESEPTADLYALFFLVLAALSIGGIALGAARQRGGYSAGRGGRWSSSGPVFWGGGGGFRGGGGGGFSGGGGGSGGGGASGGW
jgi:uncharacterized protein